MAKAEILEVSFNNFLSHMATHMIFHVPFNTSTNTIVLHVSSGKRDCAWFNYSFKNIESWSSENSRNAMILGPEYTSVYVP